MDRIDMLMIGVASYVAVLTLVRLMAARRDEVIRHVRAEIDRRRDEAAAETDDDRTAA